MDFNERIFPSKLVFIYSIGLIYCTVSSNLIAQKILGEQRIAVLLLDYQNDPNKQDASFIDSALFIFPNSIKSFVEEISYGKATLSGAVYDWIIPPEPLLSSPTPEDSYRYCATSDQVIGQIVDDLNIDLDLFDGVVLMINDTLKNQCFGGISTFGPVPISTSQGTKMVRRSMFRAPFYRNDFSQTTQSTVAHELLHSFGASYHSNSYICTNDAIAADPNDCIIQGYGNVFDMMGVRDFGSHPTAMIKEQMGWFEPSNFCEVISSSTYDIMPLEITSSDVQAIKIPLLHPIPIKEVNGIASILIYDLYVEMRAPIGFDWRSPFLSVGLMGGGRRTFEHFNGPLIVGKACNSAGESCFPILLDMHPNSIDESYSLHELYDAYLLEGESFQVPYNDISIQCIEIIDSTRTSLKIAFGPDYYECNSSISLVDTISSAKYNSSSLIESSGLITSFSNVIFSSDEVELNYLFTIDNGARFQIDNERCSVD